MKRKLLSFLGTVVVSLLAVSAVAWGQEKKSAKVDSISLLDTKKVVDYLGLSKPQKDTILVKIAQIQKIVDEDKKVREELRSKFVPGQGTFNREAFQTLRNEQMERQKKIDALAEEIQKKLNAKQQEKFKTVLAPNLREIARAERAQWGGMRPR